MVGFENIHASNIIQIDQVSVEINICYMKGFGINGRENAIIILISKKRLVSVGFSLALSDH